jgi:flagellar biosynthetic protein FliP
MTVDRDVRHLCRPAAPSEDGRMTAETKTIRTRPNLRANLRFAGHYLAMVVAMMVGMAALGPLASLAWPGLSDRPAADAMVMAATMTIGMALWMRIRRHRWVRIGEMSAAMVAPFAALLVPYWLGAISGDALMMGGHMLMFVTMLATMLWRHREYRHGHH